MSLKHGTTLANYQILAPLGAGGMGEVYRARDTKLGREVAIKVLPEQFSESRESVARFEREAKVLASLDHPNIGAIYGFEQANDTRFLVLQLVEGETLAERLQRGPLPLHTALDVCRQIAEALEAAHEKGVIHRDLKPANVKITPDGKVKVLDFGIAKGMLDEPTAQSSAASEETPTVLSASTRPGALLGTPAYMSPEQARGEAVDKRSDIWSFGCVLFECLTGTKLFESATPIDSLHAVLHKEPDWSALPADTPPRIQLLAKRCLTRDRKKRLSDIREAWIEIDAALAEPESSAPALDPVSTGWTSEPKSKPVERPGKRFFPATLAATGILILAAVTWWTYHRFGSTNPPQASAPDKTPNQLARPSETKSIAVLPFANTSADKGDDSLSDGLTDEFINTLQKVKGLRVQGRTSSFFFKGKNESIQKMGEQLGVKYLLEGSVSKALNKLRITAELVAAADGFQLWSSNYDREMSDIFVIRSDVAQQVAAALKVQLGVEETQSIAKKPTENLEAYDLYLQGRYYWNRRSPEALQKGIDYFQQAVEKDPQFALGYAGLADCYTTLVWYSDRSPRQAVLKGRAAAVTALRIDPTLPEAHTSLALILTISDWDWTGAEREFREAIRLKPAYPTAHHWYCLNHLAATGRIEQAIDEIKIAHELDPLSLIINSAIGRSYYLARNYESAIQHYGKTLQMDPDFISARREIGMVYLQMRRYDDAIAALHKALNAWTGDTLAAGYLGYVYAMSGRRTEAEKLIHELSQRSYVAAYEIALIHTGLGEKDRAFTWLHKALEDPTGWLIYIKVEPGFDSLHSDPRFAELLRNMKLDK